MTPDEELLTPAFYADPYPVYERLREAGPIHWSERTGGRWLVTTYAGSDAALRDNRRSKQMVPALMSNRPPEAQEELQPLVASLSKQMLFADPPEHTRLRGLVSKAFTPRTVETLRPHIQQVANRLLDAAIAAGEMDLIRDFAYPLPAIVICEMLGIPPERRDEFRRWSDDAALW